ncbi:MAG: hypothetical protein M0D55_17150 [Elusimicrobiota bacterium]|nr:MAG: hypothetical protein M0D55_17150 [Elusimicrobiota bacterium]
MSARAAEHLDWVAARALGADGPPKGFARGALDRMGFEAPSLAKDAGFLKAAADVPGGRGLVEGPTIRARGS